MTRTATKQIRINNLTGNDRFLDPEPDHRHAATQPEPDIVSYAWPENPFQKNEAHICIVGEAPGADEVKQGTPFVGRSGQLLNKALQEAGIERSACLVANVFRLQPPGNKVDYFFRSIRAASQAGLEIDRSLGSFGSSWCLKEFAAELENLRDALEKFKPDTIIALGRTPLWALTGENGIMALRGQTMTCRLYPPAKVVPTFHPSFILRGNWASQPLWVEDLRKAKKLAAKK